MLGTCLAVSNPHGDQQEKAVLLFFTDEELEPREDKHLA
jgi:hypothetical protein